MQQFIRTLVKVISAIARETQGIFYVNIIDTHTRKNIIVSRNLKIVVKLIGIFQTGTFSNKTFIEMSGIVEHNILNTSNVVYHPDVVFANTNTNNALCLNIMVGGNNKFLNLNIITDTVNEARVITTDNTNKLLDLNVITVNSNKLISLNALDNSTPVVNNSPKKKINRYTLAIFLERAYKLYGDKYDYTGVGEKDVTSCNSKVSVKCNICGSTFLVTVNNHIIRSSECRECSPYTFWNYDVFVRRAKKIHGDKYDYSKINPSDVTGINSRVSIICNTCKYEWDPTVSNHIHGRYDCPDCQGKVPWDYERFIKIATLKFGGLCNYSKVVSSDILNKDSKIIVICRICDYEWYPTIHNHIRSGSCPSCSGHAPITYERLIESLTSNYGEKCDYSKIKHSDIFKSKSKIDVICKICAYEWRPIINNHMRSGSCPNCSGHAPLTFERFLDFATKIHGNRFLYTDPDTSINHRSKIHTQCTICHNYWYVRCYNHIGPNKSGCPHCNKSKGELACENYLIMKNVMYKCQFVVDGYPRKRYDFMFRYGDNNYVLEYDGRQHFSFNSFFHENYDVFLKNQEVDFYKTVNAINEGFLVIRISHKQFSSIPFHIENALSAKQKLYCSNIEDYIHITNEIDQYI